MHRILILIAITCLVLVAATPDSAISEKQALLIGISKYQNMPDENLDGPVHDVRQLKKTLINLHGYPEKNISVLLNEQASKTNILGSIKELVHNTRPGNEVFIYFSGHGTSRYDSEINLPLPHSTGALVPADFSFAGKETDSELVSALIVGKRDLKPILKRLDQKCKVLAVFDTCYSGQSVRSLEGIESKVKNRFFPLRGMSKDNGIDIDEPGLGEFGENTRPIEPYPYRNLFYLAASSAYEPAKDIQEENLQQIQTVDGRPHGVFSDALLRVLMGRVEADTNNDGQISGLELYKAVRSKVKERFRQTPQALPKQGAVAEELKSRSWFSARQVSVGSLSSATRDEIEVDIQGNLSKLRKSLNKSDKVKLVSSNPDLMVLKDRGEIVLTLPNKHQLCRITQKDSESAAKDAASRILRHARIDPLIRLKYPKQQFNVSVNLTGFYQQGVVIKGDKLGFEVSTQEKAWLFLIDIAPSGEIHVLYPYESADLRPVQANKRLVLPHTGQVVPPYGTETLKLFAFKKRPKDLGMFVGQVHIC